MLVKVSYFPSVAMVRTIIKSNLEMSLFCLQGTVHHQGKAEAGARSINNRGTQLTVLLLLACSTTFLIRPALLCVGVDALSGLRTRTPINVQDNALQTYLWVNLMETGLYLRSFYSDVSRWQPK